MMDNDQQIQEQHLQDPFPRIAQNTSVTALNQNDIDSISMPTRTRMDQDCHYGSNLNSDSQNDSSYKS